MNSQLPIAIIGAGPVGLAAASHLAERRMPFVVLEAGASVGHSVRQWGHVRVFSPWRYNVDRASAGLLQATGWRQPDLERLPTGREIVEEYLEPLATALKGKGSIRLNARVTAVGRLDYDKVKSAGRDQQPFTVRISLADREEDLLAAGVIDTSGTWFSPNPLGSSGYAVPGEAAAAGRICYGIPDVLGSERKAYSGKTTLVVGSGHSAINTVLDLAKLAEQDVKTRVVWAVRRAECGSLFGGGAADALRARAALGTSVREAVMSGKVELLLSFRARSLTRQSAGRINVQGTHDGTATEIIADRIVVAAGFRPDFSFLKEVRLSVDPWLEAANELASLIDPNVHSCGTVRPHGAAELAHPEKNFYIAGMKAYGRAPTFLLATGYEQIRSIVAEIAGDHEAARRVELELPETGVCSTNAVSSARDVGCCGGPAPAEVNACCVADVNAKAAGEEGCGCAIAPVKVAIPVAKKASACCGSQADVGESQKADAH